MKKTGDKKRFFTVVFTNILVFFFLMSVLSCTSSELSIDPVTARNEIIGNKLGVEVKNPVNVLSQNAKIKIYVDNSFGMLGYQYRNNKDQESEELNLYDVLKKLELLNCTLEWRQFVNNSKSVNTKTLRVEDFSKESYYSNTITPLADNISHAYENLKDNESAIIVTDGIEDRGSNTSYASCVKRIREWIYNKGFVQIISIPMLFRGKRWYSPIDNLNLDGKCYTDHTTNPDEQKMYFIIFSKFYIDNMTLGEYIINKTLIKCCKDPSRIELIDCSPTTFNIRSTFCDPINKRTFQDSSNENDYDFTATDFTHHKNINFVDYRAQFKKNQKEKVSIGKLTGSITLPKNYDLKQKEVDLEIRFYYFQKNGKAEEIKSVVNTYTFDFDTWKDDIESEDSLKKELLFVTKDIVVNLPKMKHNSNVLYVSVKSFLPVDFTLNNTYIRASFPTICKQNAYGFKSGKKENMIFTGFNELELLEVLNEFYANRDNKIDIDHLLKLDFSRG